VRYTFAWRATIALVALLASAPIFAQQTTANDPAAQGLTPEQEAIQKEVARQMAERDKNAWKFGIRPNGGGFFMHSPDDNIQFRLLGYAQAVGTVVNEDFINTFGSSDVRVRRARVGWYLLYQKKYELFVEYDGVPVTGNLVEARVDWAIRGDDLRLRAGKMVVPLSEEGWRSSRNYDTIERFIVINTMYGLPAEDTQIGAMLHGQILAGNKLTWYVGAWNGNAAAADNPRDNNDDKEYQAKVTYAFSKTFRGGFGVGTTTEETQPLRLNSLSGTRFAEFNVIGGRQAVDADFLYEKEKLSFRGEVLNAEFSDSDTTLRGGFLQVAYFLSGNYNGGFQPILRIERAEIERDLSPRSSAINAITAGFNWYLNNNVRVQVNAIGEDFNRASDRSVRGDGFKPTFLSEFQIRF
jgi:hypothetical protein